MDGLQRAFVLHARPYSETSLILDVFSEQHGRLSLMAKGARAKRSKIKGALQPFTPLFLTWSGKGDLSILRHAEPISIGIPLYGQALYSAFYLNELLTRVLALNTLYGSLFYSYINALTELAQEANPEPALRRFELALLEALGYGVDFMHCAASGAKIDKQMRYLFREQQGFIASLTNNTQLSFTGGELEALAKREFTTVAELQAAKRFTRIALKPYLGSKPLKSRELFVLRTRKIL